MGEINEPDFNIDSLRLRIKEAAARSGAAGQYAAITTPTDSFPAAAGTGAFRRTDTPSHIEIAPLALQPEFKQRSDSPYHVNELLQYHDRNFIQNAYLAILKRYPDDTGFTAFIERLRAGRLNKIEILARLRYSPEGRAKKVQIKGLLLPAVIRQAYRLPVLGYLLNLCVGLARLPAAMRYQQQLEAHVLAQQERIVEHMNQVSAQVAGYSGEVSLALARHQQQAEFLAQKQQAIIESQQAMRAEIIDRLEELKQHLEEDIESLTRELKAEVERALQNQQQIRTELVSQGQRVSRLLEEASKRLPAPFDRQQLQAIAGEERHTLDAFYVSFEDQFRGSRAQIKQRLKIYLPLLREAKVGAAAMPILDIGCGRGEWLELLKEEKLQSSGVDLNHILVAQCRGRGLDVAEGDLMNYLRNLPDESLGAVTGFHIVEHLPIEVLVKLLDETVRVIKPGGMVIFETPNPQNVLVGSCNFYFDPTHRNPLPGPIMRFMVESRGFNRVRVMNLNPSDTNRVEGDSDLVRRFNEYFYGPMDYAIVAWKEVTSNQ